MTERPPTSKKRKIIILTIIFIFIVLIIFLAYKNFFKKEIIDNVANKNAVIGGVDLSPSFSIKIQDILDNFKFINLKIFSKPIKESGASGNPNPFLPYTKKQDNINQ